MNKKRAFGIIVLLSVAAVAAGVIVFHDYSDRRLSTICAKAYTELLIEMHEAQKLLDEYSNQKERRQEKAILITRHTENAKVALNNLISHASARQKTVTGLSNIEKAMQDWERFSNAVIVAYSEVALKGVAHDTGEIPAYAQLANDGFFHSVHIALSTFTNLPSEPPYDKKVKVKVYLSDLERDYLLRKVHDTFSNVCSSNSEQGRRSGMAWAVIMLRNFLKHGSTDPVLLTECDKQ